MLRLAILATFLVVASCATIDYHRALAFACDSYTSSLLVLAERRVEGKLTPPQVRAVNAARVIVNPICETGVPVVDARVALDRIANHVAKLRAIKEGQKAI